MDSVIGAARNNATRMGSDRDDAGGNNPVRESESATAGRIEGRSEAVSPNAEAISSDSDLGRRSDESDPEARASGRPGFGLPGNDSGTIRDTRPAERAGMTGVVSAVEETRSDDFLHAPIVTEYQPEDPDERGAGESGFEDSDLFEIDGVFILGEETIEIPDLAFDAVEDRGLADVSVVANTMAEVIRGAWQQVDLEAGANEPDFAPGGYRSRAIAFQGDGRTMVVLQRHAEGIVLAGDFRIEVDGEDLEIVGPVDPPPFARTAPGIVALGGDYAAATVDPPARLEIRWDDGEIEIGTKRYRRMDVEAFQVLRSGGRLGADAPAGTVRAPSRGPGSGQREIDFFGIPADVRHLCFIVDRSGSMAANDRIGLVKQHLEKTIMGLRSEVRFEVIFFGAANQADAIDGAGWSKASSRNKKAFTAELAKVGATGGGTDPTGAFDYAFHSLDPRPDLVIFLTDGMVPPTVVPQLQTLNAARKPARIDTFAIGAGGNEAILRQIASEHRGKFKKIE